MVRKVFRNPIVCNAFLLPLGYWQIRLGAAQDYVLRSLTKSLLLPDGLEAWLLSDDVGPTQLLKVTNEK